MDLKQLLAAHANQLSSGNRSIVLRILAAAYAEAGRFAEAIETARNANAFQLAQAENNAVLAQALPKEISLNEPGFLYHKEPNRSGSQMSLIGRKCFAEWRSRPVKSNLSFQDANQTWTTLRRGYFHASLRCIDRFRKSAALGVSGSERAGKI
jgi:hypothetical protein